MISPSLFDIYMNKMLKEMKSELNNNLEIFAYADDLAILLNEDDTEKAIKFLERIELSYNLKMNKKKLNENSNQTSFCCKRGQHFRKRYIDFKSKN